MIQDPTRVRLSDHFLLSDFMGCHSVYSKGYSNVFDQDTGGEKLANGYTLADTLEYLLETRGALSISYGYISPELSRKVVTYQNPDKPSYHRWDLGAAADVRFHDAIYGDALDGSPIGVAHSIMDDVQDLSRLITYSESPWLCIATGNGSNNDRRAFYENRYEGHKGRKPKYVNMSSGEASREREWGKLAEQDTEFSWRGHGYPTYHGKGVLQLHHRDTGRVRVLSDWLFNLKLISTGAVNIPDLTNVALMEAFEAASYVYETIIDSLPVRFMSIVSGYVDRRNRRKVDDWEPWMNWAGHVIGFKVNTPYDITAMGYDGVTVTYEGEGEYLVTFDVTEMIHAKDRQNIPGKKH